MQISAASPRLRAAFGWLTSDAACIVYKQKAAAELAKHEALQRIEQLAARRAEQTSAAQAMGVRAAAGTCMATLVPGDGAARSTDGPAACRAADGELWRELDEEHGQTTRELRRVRAEYDEMKWKGRWTE